MAPGRRCDLGCASWPDSDEYNECPTCGEATTRFGNLTPLPDDEARTITLKIKFDEFYEARCIERGIPTDGPLGS
jgi:hypothetical protein